MMPTAVRLVFDDFVDLQTRLLLLPRIEEEGRGAIIASYSPLGAHKKNHESIGPSDSMEEVDLEIKQEVLQSQSEESNVDEEKKTEHCPATVVSTEDVVGTMLVGVHETTVEEDGNSFCEKDFTEILACIREAPTPIVLFFQQPLADKGEVELPTVKKADADDDTSTETSASDCEEDVDATARNLFGGKLSTWTSRVRETSAQLAAEAASGAASLSTKVATAAAEASERAKANRVDGRPPISPRKIQMPPCRMFLQTSSGSFCPVQSLSSSECTVTTSSVLLIRLSTSETCPPKKYRFQWYRSCGCSPVTDDASRVSAITTRSNRSSVKSTASIGGRSNGSDENAEVESNHSDVELEWILLPGATYAAYQPSATDVGHRLRCLITVVEDESVDDESVSDCEDARGRTELCELPVMVYADSALFNGARQALVRGAKFGNLLGRGKAEGRVFMVQVEIARANTDRKRPEMTSSLTIFQVSGSTAASLQQEPIQNASAIADPSKPKRFGFLFPTGLPESASMISALSTDGKFELEAPNRIARETLLLALGIANFKGKPANLDAKTVLFPSLAPAKDVIKTDIDAESIGEISVGSSFVSASSKDTSLSPVTCFETPMQSEDYDCSDRMLELERGLRCDLRIVRSKLAKKDKVVSDLQRQLTFSESELRKRDLSLARCRKDHDATVVSLKLAERRMKTQEDDYNRLKGDQNRQEEQFQSRIQAQDEKIAAMEKTVRLLQNEKAVLSAGVDARESKLSKMQDLQHSVKALERQVSEREAVSSELSAMEEKFRDVTEKLSIASLSEKQCKEDLGEAHSTIEKLNATVEEEKKRRAACQSRLNGIGSEVQKIKAERNSFKQKADSLSKEMSRICRNGLTIADVERIIQDEEARRTEVSLLKAQKRKALEEADLYRTAFDHSVAAQSKARIDVDAVRALEQKAELERVVSDLTEYLKAKEMQLETMKQVNQSLQDELYSVANQL